MLVGAFEIDIGRPFQVRTVFQREGVGAATVEPDIKDVHDLCPLRMVVVLPKKTILGTFGKPGIRAFDFESRDYASIDGFVDQHFTLLIGKDGDRHAPGALAGQHPVRAVLDHGAQSVLAGGRHEAGLVDGRKCA
jgi:hypothetical protein